jgi:hypothetical protein
MAQTNYTPISLYYSTTASAVPTAANLVPGELAINTNDGKLYYEDSSGVVRVLASKSTGSIGGSTTQVQFNSSGSLGGSSGLTWDGSFLTTSSIKNSALTSGRVTYAGASGLLSDSANLTFDGTNLTNGSITSSITVAKVSISGTGIGYLGVDSYTVNGIYLINNNTGTTTTGVTTATVGLMGTGAYPLVLGTNSTERIRITSAGLVGIGTSSPSSLLHLSSSSSTGQTITSVGTNVYSSVSFLNTTTGYGYDVGFGGSASVAPNSFYIYGGSTASVKLAVDASGIVTMGAYGAGAATFSASGVISSVSDETWKIKDGVPVNTNEMLQKLEPGYWFYNEEKAPTFGQERQLGFYAQNVREAIGEEAAPTPEEGKPWGYYDRSVLAITVMSLKNALSTIEELKQKITALENK